MSTFVIYLQCIKSSKSKRSLHYKETRYNGEQNIKVNNFFLSRSHGDNLNKLNSV